MRARTPARAAISVKFETFGWYGPCSWGGSGRIERAAPRRHEETMALDVDALRTSFEIIVERSPELTHRFYEVLFERYPQVRRLFGRNSGAQQEKMLTQALAAVIEHLEDGPWLAQTLGALGAKHDDYGVTREMYGWVGESLLVALGEALGPDWTPRNEKAWTGAYGAIAGLMQAGSAAPVEAVEPAAATA